jgi:hypothetical protein
LTLAAMLRFSAPGQSPGTPGSYAVQGNQAHHGGDALGTVLVTWPERKTMAGITADDGVLIHLH